MSAVTIGASRARSRSRGLGLEQRADSFLEDTLGVESGAGTRSGFVCDELDGLVTCGDLEDGLLMVECRPYADRPLSPGELHLSETSGSLLAVSSTFGTPLFELHFELVTSSPPTGSIRLDADFHSKATGRGL